MRLVLDANLLVSYLINPGATVINTVDLAFGSHAVLYSDATIAELGSELIKTIPFRGEP